ncbi:putative glutathione S-transferase [Capsicum chinense]|nr:putative glutathione S-transferase [Capsicum chinense]
MDSDPNGSRRESSHITANPPVFPTAGTSTIRLKGKSFSREDLQNKSPFLLESNPVLKKIPVLIHNGKPICKSMIILEYIDEAFEGPSILPKYPYESAIARFWAKFFDGKVKFCLLHHFPLWHYFIGDFDQSSGASDEQSVASEDLSVASDCLSIASDVLSVVSGCQELDSEVHSRRLTEKQRPTLGIDHSNKILHCTVKFDGFQIDKAEDLMKMVQILWLLECHSFEDSVPDELTRDEEILTNFEEGNNQLEYRINKLEASLKIIEIHILQQASDLLQGMLKACQGKKTQSIITILLRKQ